MKAMILAAGFGSRLGALTRHRPKPLIEIEGDPIIVHVIRTLNKTGITQIVINLHHHGEMIRAKLGDGRQFDAVFEYIEEPEILGTGGGLLNAEFFFDPETFILMNGDILTDVSLTDAIRFHRSNKSDATMLLKKPQPGEDAAVTVDPDGRVTDLRGKRAVTKASSSRVFTGIHILEPSVFDYLRAQTDKPLDIIDGFYQPALDEGAMVWGYDFDGFWMDIGTPDNLKRAEEAWRSRG